MNKINTIIKNNKTEVSFKDVDFFSRLKMAYGVLIGATLVYNTGIINVNCDKHKKEYADHADNCFCWQCVENYVPHDIHVQKENNK